jgi:hypothetical protein
VKVPEGANIKAFSEELMTNSDVEYVERIPVIKVILETNDPSAPSQYHLTTTKAKLGWDILPTTFTPITIGICDDAVQINHPDLAENCIQGYDVADQDNDPSPPNTDYSHGTHVAGIAGAVTNNGIGVAAVSFNRIKLLPVKSTNSGGGSITHAYEGVVWASEHGAKVINTSWGGGGYSTTYQQIANDVYNRGILWVASAGNSSSSTVNYPAGYNHVLSVVSTDDADRISYFSTYGSWVDICAPGSSIYSTVPFGSYATYSGTSMASPMVASLAALVWSSNPSWTPDQVEQHLKTNADNIDELNPNYVGLLGAGRINVFKSIGCFDASLTPIIAISAGNSSLCPRDSATISSTSEALPNVTYSWRRNGVAIVGANSTVLKVFQNGTYTLSAVNNSTGCIATSNVITISYNATITSNPMVASSLVVCEGHAITALEKRCANTRIIEKTYTGATIGYDGGQSSGSNPSITVSDSLEINKVELTITFKKQDSGGANTCGENDGGGNAYNNELSFKLRSPMGEEISLIAAGTYVSGTTTAGVVTITFKDESSAINLGSNPQSGSFRPADLLSTYNRKYSKGIWTLIPNDNVGSDPLCVSGFSMKISVKDENMGAISQTSWWADSLLNRPLGTGRSLIPRRGQTPLNKYYVQYACDGSCPSVRVPVTAIIKSYAGRPTALGTVTVSSTTASSISDLQKVIDAKTTIIVIEQPGNKVLVTSNEPTTQRIIIGNGPSWINPITVCPNQSMLLLATGCVGETAWGGVNGAGRLVNPTVTTSYRAICVPNESQCINENVDSLVININATAVMVTDTIYENAQQNIIARQIVGNNVIKPVSQVEYKATNFIDLTPGFESKQELFKASIGALCPTPSGGEVQTGVIKNTLIKPDIPAIKKP